MINKEKQEQLKIVSMNKIHYLEEWLDCEGKEQITPNEKYVLNCISPNDAKYQIVLWETNGSCGSGYCDASWGNIEFKCVNHFGEYNHMPKDEIDIQLNMVFNTNTYEWEIKENDIGCYDGYGVNIENIFSANGDGGDSYYPSGSVYVNENLFVSNSRYSDKPFVHIFYGDSSSGKSFLSNQLDKVVFETDTVDSLPDEIIAEVIVVGNKNNYTIEEIKSHIKFDAKFVVVNFNVQ